jgi:hypothetical protein
MSIVDYFSGQYGRLSLFLLRTSGDRGGSMRILPILSAIHLLLQISRKYFPGCVKEKKETKMEDSTRVGRKDFRIRLILSYLPCGRRILRSGSIRLTPRSTRQLGRQEDGWGREDVG